MLVCFQSDIKAADKNLFRCIINWLGYMVNFILCWLWCFRTKYQKNKKVKLPVVAVYGPN
jgi:hypothetical protein